MPSPPRRPRARPVTFTPLAELLARQEDLAKGWLVALLEALPLAQAPALVAGELSRDGPRLCGAVVRAVAGDGALAALAPGGAMVALAARAGAMAGAGDPAAAVAAVDALHGVIWSALRGALHDPEPEDVAAAAERLALVMERVRAAVLARPAPEAEREPEPEPLRDPLMEAASVEVEPELVQVEPKAAGDAEPPREPGQALWRGALQDEVERARRGRLPLSLLLLEVADADRLRASERDSGAVFGRFLQAVRAAVRRQDLLARESDGRIWVIARETGRAGAQAVADRALAEVAGASWARGPLSVCVGIAVLDEDAEDADGLLVAAEEASLAAEAQGVGRLGALGAAESEDYS